MVSLNRVLGALREGVEIDVSIGGNIESSSVTTSSIVDSDDSQEWETLRELGWQKGDIIPVATFDTGTNRSFSTTNGSFVGAFDQMQLFVEWNEITGVDVNTYVFLGIQFAGGNAADATYQMYNTTDGEVLVEIGPQPGGNYNTGWVQYTPTTVNSTVELFPRLKSESGGTSVTTNSPTFMIGMEV